jgi:hypothetical protein
VQISEFELNVSTCKLTTLDHLPSFKPYVGPGTGPSERNFYSRESEHHIKGDTSRTVDVLSHNMPLACIVHSTAADVQLFGTFLLLTCSIPDQSSMHENHVWLRLTPASYLPLRSFSLAQLCVTPCSILCLCAVEPEKRLRTLSSHDYCGPCMTMHAPVHHGHHHI